MFPYGKGEAGPGTGRGAARGKVRKEGAETREGRKGSLGATALKTFPARVLKHIFHHP
jgi:hypothetical protein